jgi:hypothetical protein
LSRRFDEDLMEATRVYSAGFYAALRKSVRLLLGASCAPSRRDGRVARLALLFATLATLCPAVTPDAQAQEQEEQVLPARPWPPMYADRRFEEDWTPPDWSRPHEGARDVFDRIKALPLTESGSIWIGFGGQARGRLAYQGTVNFGGPFDFEPTMWTWRLRPYADLHVGRHFRVFAEGIYSHSSIQALVDTLGAPESRLGFDAPNANGDLLNLFAEYRAPIAGSLQAGAWVGRRELQMGHERILSPGNWLLNRHTFDGAGGWLEKGGHRLEAFVTRPHIPVPDMFNRRDYETTFWGVFYTTTAGRQPPVPVGLPPARQQRVVFQPYLFQTQREAVAFVQGAADEDRYTGGLLTYGDVGGTGFDFEFEGMYQYGQFRTPFQTGTVQAYALTGILGYRFQNVRLFPRPYVSIDYASGDADPNDATLGTFDPLYPLAYAFFGFHAAFERKNFIAPGVNLDAVLYRNVYLRTSYWPGMWRAQKNDGVYDSFGNITRRPEPQSRGGSHPDLAEASRKIGQQIDVGVAWLPTHHLLFYGTYLRFFAGQFWTDTQTAPPTDMNGVMILAQFNF